MIAVAEALARLFALVTPTGVETVPLAQAGGRVLARPLAALRGQPGFAASAMDGYALIGAEARPGAQLTVVGESAAGRGWAGRIEAGQAVRIFTGAPLPAGADRVVIQEDVAREGATITLGARLDAGSHVRPPGLDFRQGAQLGAPRRLSAMDVALLAAFGHATVPVHRRPEVALIATGDELVLPGEALGPDQIVASNSYGLAALVAQAGGLPRLLPIARDTPAALAATLRLADGADLIVTIGGASVGEHDLVGAVAHQLGMAPAFWKVAMRPGKPLMAGRLFDGLFLGLPGNPVSALVCGLVFLAPMLAAMAGLPAAPAARRSAPAAVPLPPGGPREHYMRARLTPEGIAPFESQDSSRLGLLSEADALLIRPADAPALPRGAPCPYLPLRD